MRLSYSLLVACALVTPSLAVWRDEHADIVREVVKAIRCALGGADISHKEAAAAVGMDPALWARVLQQGGNLAALLTLAAQSPAFSRELRVRLVDLLTTREVQTCAGATTSVSSSVAS